MNLKVIREYSKG